MTNNLLNKNSLIGALIVLLLLTSWWGQSKTGTSRQLAMDKEVAEVQLASIEAEAIEARQAQQENEVALKETKKRLKQAQENSDKLAKSFSHEQAKTTTLKMEKEGLQKKISELESALEQAKIQQKQTDSAQQDMQKIAAERDKTQTTLKEAQKKLKEAESQIAQLQQQQKNIQMEASSQLVQLQQQQEEAATELESLRAQVIGFEKVVEERNAALTEVNSDLDACEVNTKVLLGKITEQEDTQLGMEEQMRNIVENLSKDAAQEESPAPEQEEQAIEQAE
ncbi:MAG: hypothetical protein SD837_05950 [Candidatus Electrothrix scaldis]|nr:MAG: hypothetical protein SD837_05950 [Candidatus Electrothrix sp. GW3-3]